MNDKAIPSVSVKYGSDGSSTKSNTMGMRPMQERVWQKLFAMSTEMTAAETSK